MTKSLTIQNKNGDTLYPITISSLVYNRFTEESIEEELDNKLESSDLKTINGVSLVGNGNITIVGEKGEKGDTGSVTVTDGVALITIVNDLTTGGTGDALSALLGKVLNTKIEGVKARFNTTTAYLLALVIRKLAYIDTSILDTAGQLITLLETQTTVVSILASYIGGLKYIGDSISTSDFSVVATYDDGTYESVAASSVSPTVLTSSTNLITVAYGALTTTVNVSAQFNQPISLTNISTTLVASEGDTVDLTAISYTIVYQNGNSVEMEDSNIITASPTTLVLGSNTITIALVDYPSVTGTLTINAGEAVTSAVVTLNVSSDMTSLDLTFDEPMAIMPTNIAITSTDKGGTVAGTTIRSATITYNSSTETWGGSVTVTGGTADLSTITVVVNESNGKYTGASISHITYTPTTTSYPLKFSASRSPYTFTFTS